MITFVSSFFYDTDVGLTGKDLAMQFGITPRQLKYKLAKAGLSLRAAYSPIDQQELENLVREMCTENNELGEVMLRARLLLMGYRVQRRRVRQAIEDTVGHLIQPRRLQRRVYRVRGPLSLFHIDANHKLIR